MKKVFKTSVLAAGVLAAFGASAATIIVQPADKIELSQQGLNVGLNADTQVIFDTVVDNQHPGLAEIVVTLGENVDLALVADGACAPAVDAGTIACGDVLFDVGTGSFTFDNLVIDADAGTLTYTVSLGNSITAGSSYRTTIGDGAGADPEISGAFSVDYASNLNGTEIETGTATLATVVDQYGASVTEEYNGVIERIDRLTFVRDGETATSDVLELTFTDVAADVANRAFVNEVVVTISGDFSADGNPAGFVSAGGTAVVVNDTTATITYDEAEWDAIIGADGTDTLTYTKPANPATIEASDFEVETVKVEYSSLTAGAGTVIDTPETILSAADAGEWRLDAAVINVPYMPVGFGLNPQVEIANDSASSIKSEIIVEAYGDNGEIYGPATLPFTADGQKVTTVREIALQTALDIPTTEKVKLSVTFLIDADLENVSVAPYYKQNESRINVLSDQYKSDTAQGN